MRRSIRRIFGAVLLSVCIGAPIAEMFDRWDHTARDGNDTETNLVVAAVCIGIGFVAAAAFLRRVRPSEPTHHIILRPLVLLALISNLGSIAVTPDTSPPSVLRI